VSRAGDPHKYGRFAAIRCSRHRSVLRGPGFLQIYSLSLALYDAVISAELTWRWEEESPWGGRQAELAANEESWGKAAWPQYSRS
jgi:hypothetical protein